MVQSHSSAPNTWAADFKQAFIEGLHDVLLIEVSSVKILENGFMVLKVENVSIVCDSSISTYIFFWKTD